MDKKNITAKVSITESVIIEDSKKQGLRYEIEVRTHRGDMDNFCLLKLFKQKCCNCTK